MGMGDILAEVVAVILIGCNFLATIRVVAKGIYPIEFNNGIWEALSSEYWFLVGFVMLWPWAWGDFARGHLSPLPWKVFLETQKQEGVFPAILSTLNVVSVDVMSLVGFAAYKRNGLREKIRDAYEAGDNHYAATLRGEEALTNSWVLMANVLFGLLVMSKGNLLYQALSLFIGIGPRDLYP